MPRILGVHTLPPPTLMQSFIQESTRIIEEGTVNTSVLASKTPKTIEVVKGTRDATHKKGQTIIRSEKNFEFKRTSVFEISV